MRKSFLMASVIPILAFVLAPPPTSVLASPASLHHQRTHSLDKRGLVNIVAGEITKVGIRNGDEVAKTGAKQAPTSDQTHGNAAGGSGKKGSTNSGKSASARNSEMSEQVAKNDVATPAERNSGSTLDDMPADVLSQVTKNLGSNDQTMLRMASKSLQKSVTPSVWDLFLTERNLKASSSSVKFLRSNQYSLYSFCLRGSLGVMKNYGSIDACLKAVDKDYPNANVVEEGFEGQSALQTAVTMKNIPVASVLLKRGSDPNMAIGLAANRGDLEMTKLLLENGANPNFRGPAGTTPLMETINYYSGVPSKMEESIKLLECAKLLLARGAKTDVKDSRGQTALDIAIKAQDTAMIQLLRPSV